MTLQGFQLSALPEVAPYAIANSPGPHLRESSPPEHHHGFRIGDRVRVIRGFRQGLESIVTAIDLTLKHSISLEPGKGRIRPDFLEVIGESSPPEQLAPLQPGHQRRHSPKGQARGWLKERSGNTNRQRPTISLYYCWDEPVQGEAGKEYRRHQLYVPKSAAPMVHQLIAEQRPVADIVAVIKSAPRRRKR